MTGKTRFLAVIVALAVAVTSLGLIAFADDDEIRPRRIRFTSTKKTFDVDDTYVLEYEILPDDYNLYDFDVTWRSSDSDVVDVDDYGEITCYEPGTATITARTTKYSASGSITITVRGATVRQNTTPDFPNNSTTTRTPTPSSGRDVTLTKIADRDTVVNAVKSAAGRTATLTNYASVSIDTLKAAAKAGTGKINFVTRDSNSFMGRLTINPSDANRFSTGTIKLGVYQGDEKTHALQSTYDTSYVNKLQVVKFDQSNFGLTVRACVWFGKGVQARNLVFYTYDASKGTLSKTSVSNVSVDSNGFVSFDTSKGGTLIISEGSLQRA